MPDERLLQSFESNFCYIKLSILLGVGYINDDNTVNEVKLRKLVEKKAREDQNVDAIVEECKAVKATIKETALHLLNCLKTHELKKHNN